MGWVCGKNFHHDAIDPMETLTVKGVFRKCLVAWKASNDATFGTVKIEHGKIRSVKRIDF